MKLLKSQQKPLHLIKFYEPSWFWEKHFIINHFMRYDDLLSGWCKQDDRACFYEWKIKNRLVTTNKTEAEEYYSNLL
jgi:hypothetical protein